MRQTPHDRQQPQPPQPPNTMAASDPNAKPTSTRDMLIDTSARISPLSIMGIAVRITSSGGGMRNGLKMKVDSTCQERKAIAIEPAVRRNPRPGTAAKLRNGASDGRGRSATSAGLPLLISATL